MLRKRGFEGENTRLFRSHCGRGEGGTVYRGINCGGGDGSNDSEVGSVEVEGKKRKGGAQVNVWRGSCAGLAGCFRLPAESVLIFPFSLSLLMTSNSL